MTDLTQFVQIRVDKFQKEKTILTNVVKMLTNRGFLKTENLDKNIKYLTGLESDMQVYKIPLENHPAKFCHIKMLNQKITAVNKASGILDFLALNENEPNIVIVREANKKAFQQIRTSYKNSELFLEDELMINIVDHDFVPEHTILHDIDVNEFIEQYKCKKKSNIPRILATDPVAKYYGMKVGQICKITRPSELSGYEYFYRLVVKGKN
jgi:DNA-directed RNA polymerase subunit H (RpoH/RPB5)